MLNFHRVLGLAALLFALLIQPVRAANLHFFSGFTSGAVLQREMPIPIWGWAKPGDAVTVSFAGQKIAAKADDSGYWRVEFQPLAATSTGADLTASSASGETAVSRDVVVGEVWFCSGQSNMADFVGRSTTIAQELARPANPLVRHFRTDVKAVALTPQKEVDGAWQTASPTMLKDANVSAVAYYMARRLNEELKVPVGVIVSAVGATNIQSWMPAAVFDRTYSDDPNSKLLARLRDDKPFVNAEGKRLTNGGFVAQLELIEKGELKLQKGVPTSLFNAQIAPHVGTAIRGFAWYQGEANRGDGMRYHTYLKALIDSWRAAWKRPDLPFLFAQISAYQYGGKDSDRSAEIWEAQTYTLKVPGTAMVVTHDIGDLGDIHPPNKKPVGERFALQALNKVYGQKILADSPRYLSHQVENGAILVKFRDVGDGLVTSDGKPLSWFTLAGADGVFVPAEAVIVAPDTVRVAAATVPNPTKVRFAWDNVAQPNLVNSAGLPAAAFRSDSAHNLTEP